MKKAKRPKWAGKSLPTIVAARFDLTNSSGGITRAFRGGPLVVVWERAGFVKCACACGQQFVTKRSELRPLTKREAGR